ncbi:MAG TPA: TonB family protein [Burkholderiales bacterium]
MSPPWPRLGLALGVSALLHLAVLLVLREPAQWTKSDFPLVVLMDAPAPAAQPAAPPDRVSPAKPERPAAREARKATPAAPTPAESSNARRPSASVTAGPASRPRLLAPESGLADAATYVDASQLRRGPRLVGPFAATYPPQAYQQRRKGVVLVQLMIDESGEVSEAVALPGASDDLAAAALGALRRARFHPAEGPEGRPVRARAYFAVSFVLE